MGAKVTTGHRVKKYTKHQLTLSQLLLRCCGGLVLAVLFLIPYVVMFFGSVKSKQEIRSVNPTYLPQEWHLENYINMWSTPETPLVNNLVSTIVISVGATLLVLLVALPAAYYTARVNFPMKKVFLSLVIVTQMLQPAVLTAGLFREFSLLGINNTWLAMILVNAAFNLSFATWIMHSFFASIPKEIEEAAQVDGASQWKTLTRINLPLVWPGIVTATIFAFVACWNEFAASLVLLNSAELQPLSVALTKFVGQYETSWHYVFGVSIISVVPVVILFMLIEKRLIGGLTAGAVK
ncbi:carbohydrate ABC transporter permease [Canibacter zhoujuaniae]|uniref:carbohydrate ABC transporter permease n=1 Tax=Canibacter zhoujuaniae TaxID=2708343 RepID=UPI001FBB26B0|nr:carbohydrate ABC transporter permease [Canibacter zhoujuaniae]